MTPARIERTRAALREDGWIRPANKASDADIESLILAVERAAWEPAGIPPDDDRSVLLRFASGGKGFGSWDGRAWRNDMGHQFTALPILWRELPAGPA